MCQDRTVEAGRNLFDDILEAQAFRDFLRTKNGVMVFRLVGHDNGEEVINRGNIETR